MVSARKEYMRKYQREYAARNRREWLTGKFCVKCGSIENLEVDHIDRTQKVTHSVWGWGEAKRDIELAKCQVLCKKCHKEKTFVDLYSNVPEHGPRTYRRGCRCDICRESAVKRMAEYRNRKKQIQKQI